MNNLELAREKLEAARIILGAIDSYLETAERLQIEARKLSDEALALIVGDENGINQDNEQRQPGTPLAGGTTEALPGGMPHDASAQG
jgi:hypothetical protein